MSKTYIPKEISWLSFNERVLQEAENKDVPLMERFKFLGIYSNNLDEYFRVRVATLRRLSQLGARSQEVLGYSPKATLKKVYEIVLEQNTRFEKIYSGLLQELEKHNIKKGERLLFKTRNSPLTYTSDTFVEDYVYLEGDAAEYLAEKKILLFGLDNITIGDFKDEASIRKTHQTLLEAGIYILEDCALGEVPPGDYELLCLPLLIYKGDAAPCRAILRPLK